MNSYSKRRKLKKFKNNSNHKLSKRTKFASKELEEKKQFDRIIQSSVEKDKRENERIRLERQRKTIREKELRDEQLILEHKKKEMYNEEK